jgi:hypothetical protein
MILDGINKKRGGNGIISRKLLLQRLCAKLAATKRACAALVAEQQQSKYHEQVCYSFVRVHLYAVLQSVNGF